MEERTFETYMRACVEDVLRERGCYEPLTLREIVKSNDRKLTGICYADREVTPCLYLGDAYQRFVNGESPYEIANMLADELIEHSQPRVDLNVMTDYDSLKEKLFVRVVDLDDNREWLKDKVCRMEGDFAKVYGIQLDEGPEGTMCTTLTVGHAAALGVPECQIVEDAEKNLRREPYVFRTLFQTLIDLDPNIAEMMGIEQKAQGPYVLTNKSGQFGAVLFTRPDVLKDIGNQLGEDFYLLPSSVHEVILIPESTGMPVSDLKAMVREVNNDVVAPEDKLSDKVQRYDRGRGRLENADVYLALNVQSRERFNPRREMERC